MNFAPSGEPSELYNCRLEEYEKSENPRVVNSWDFQGSNNPPIRLFYINIHYASVSSSGGRNSNIQTIEPSEMEQKMLSQCQLLKTKDLNNISTRSVEELSIADPELHYAFTLLNYQKQLQNQENRSWCITLQRKRNEKRSSEG